MFNFLDYILKKLKVFWLLVGIVFLIVLFIEAFLSFGLSLYTQVTDGLVDPRLRSKVYKNKSWANEYFKEFHESMDFNWAPYVYWRRQKYQGNYITVDSHGIRETWKPGTIGSCDRTTKIFMMGGSTLWGTGARNNYTIPSHLSKFFNKRQNRCVRVINHGESGYVSTQSLFYLTKLLQQGKEPDYVVFYNGINDIISAHQQRRAGVTYWENLRQTEFRLTKDLRRLLKIGVLRLWVSSSLHELFIKLGFSSHHSLQFLNFDSRPPQNLEKLAISVVQTYRKNMRMAQVLGDKFDFETDFFWQPVIFTKKKLTKYESKRAKKWRKLRPFFRLVYKKVAGHIHHDEFHNLSKIFVTDEPIFIDSKHTSESGNKKIARAIFSRLKRRFEKF